MRVTEPGTSGEAGPGDEQAQSQRADAVKREKRFIEERGRNARGESL
jgi:hypothetical protein